MEHPDFKIGTLFRTATGLWRCTDVGTRTIAAIHLENVEVNGTSGRRTLNHDEAEAQGWFRGPPYIVVEEVFDEYDLEGCEPDNLLDFPGYEYRPPKRDWSQADRGEEAVAARRERRAAQLLAAEERDGPRD
jgi:hypothetical protein